MRDTPTSSDSAWLAAPALALIALWWFARALPPWGDEAHFLDTVRLFGQGLSLELLRTYPEMSGPLPFALYAGWGRLVGFDTASLRALSIIIAFLTIATYSSALGHLGFRERRRPLLVAVFALNPYFIGLSVFVFTDMLALFGMALTMRAVAASGGGGPASPLPPSRGSTWPSCPLD